MKARKPSEKFTLGLQGRVITAVVSEVVEAAANELAKSIRARRRQLVKHKVRPEVLKLWDTIMNEYLDRASHGHGSLWLLLTETDYHLSMGERQPIFREAAVLLKEDGLKGNINIGCSMLERHGLGYEVNYTWSS